MAFQTGGEVAETKPFQTGGAVALEERTDSSEGLPPDTFTQITQTDKATDLLPEDEREIVTSIESLQANPQDQDARYKASIYFAERLGIKPEEANSLLSSISKHRWGEPDMSAEQIFGKIVSSENSLIKNQVGESQDLAPFSTFGNAFKQSLAGKPAEALKGAQVFTPGKAGDIADVGLARASDFFLSLQNIEKKKEIDTKLQGRLWPVNEGDRWFQINPKALPETINTWAANIGDQIPLMLLTMAGRAAGKATGKVAGKAVGVGVALATGGPDPTDALTAPAAAEAIEKIATHIGGAAPMVAIEAAGFMDHAGELGIDKDISEGYARWYGSLSGVIEYSQFIFRMKAFKGLTKKGQGLVMKKIFKTIGAAGLIEGLEELSQNGLQNHLINKAIADQKVRNPAFAAEELKLLEGGGRSFAIGAGVSMFTTGVGSATVRGGRALSDAARKAMDKISEDFATKPIEEVAEAAPITPEEQASGAVPLTPEEQSSVDFLVSRGTSQEEAERLTRVTSEVLADPVSDIEPSELDKVEGQVAVDRAQAQEAKPPIIKSDDDFSDFFEGFEADEVIARKPEPEATVQSTAKTRKQISTDVLNDPVFKLEADAIEQQKQQIDVVTGKFFIPKKFRGEVKAHLEGDPSLKKNITFDPSKGQAFDEAIQEGFLLRIGGTEGELDVSDFLQRLSEAKASRKKVGGIPQVVLDKMVSSGDPFSEIVAIRHDMFHKGFTIAEINEAVAIIATENKIEVQPLLETKEDVAKRERVSKRAPGEKGKLTREEAKAAGREKAAELRTAQEEGEAVGFRAGERESREKAKVEILKLKQAQKLTDARRTTATELVKTFVEKENRGDFIKRIASAKTPRDLEKINEAIEKGVLRAEKKQAIAELKSAIKSINPKKMLPEFAKTARSIINSLQLGKIRPDTQVKLDDMRAMASQVLDNAREDSVAAHQAQQLLTELQGKTAKTFAVNQLSIDSLRQITDTLVALRFQNDADTIAAKDENAKEAIRRRSAIKSEITVPPVVPANLGGEASSKVLKKFKLIHDNLESVSDAVSGARPGTYELWTEAKRALTQYVYDVIDTGVDNQVRHSDDAKDIMRQILTDNKVTSKDILNWSMRPQDVSKVQKAFNFGPKPVVHTFTLKDSRDKSTEYNFTGAELMSIFMHTRNSHNLAVLLNDGMDRKTKGTKEKMRGFTVEILESMVDALTAKQKNVAKQVGSKLMDKHNKDGINKTSSKLEFFDIANVENYWPARRSIIRGPKGKKLAGSNQLVESMGLLKERVGTSNPLVMAGFFETSFNSSNSAAKYVGLAEPLREVKAVYTPDVIAEMEDQGRSAEAKRITQFIERIEGQLFESDELSDIVAKMLGGFAKSKLFLNAKIAPRQQISEFLISSYVDPKYMTEFKGIASKEDIQAVRDLSPQMKARFDSLQFDRDVGDAFQRNSMMNWMTGETSLIDKTAVGMKFFDTNAIVDIYRATKAEVIDNNPDIDIESEAGQALLKDRFEWVVRHTQPVWNVKDRSLLGSSLNPLTRSLTMFMSQREQLVRMVNNGISDYVNSEKTNADALRLGRVLGSTAMNLAAFSAYNLAWALIIKKRDKDVSDALRDAMKDVISLPFFGGWFAQAFGYYFNIFTDKSTFGQRGFQEGTVEGILKNILIDGIGGFAMAGKHYVTEEKYKSGPNRGQLKWKTELFVAIDSLADAVASLKGLPYYGATDIVDTVIVQTKSEQSRKGNN